MLERFEREQPVGRIWVENIVPLPSCCPVSGNPQTGSRLRIRYRAGRGVLEVYSLRRYLEQFVGGGRGVRTMEGLVEQVAADCARLLGAPVRVVAELVLSPAQQMRLIVRCRPPQTGG